MSNRSAGITFRTTADLSGAQQLDTAYQKLSASEQRLVRDNIALAQSYARVLAANGQAAQGAASLQATYAGLSGAPVRSALALQGQIASLSREAAGAGSFAQQFATGIKSGLVSIAGPAALAATAIGALKGAIDFTEESFKLKAALDTTNLSIQAQLKNFRDVNATLNDGRAFAARYALTQQENSEAIQASIPILRQSKASLQDVESVLLRLSVLKPEQGISGAAFALAELQGGQARSLATRFNVPIAKATELKNEIKNGGDATQVVGRYLDSVGIGMDALAVRTQGATGKMNELRVETEKLQFALAGQAGGPGLAILDAKIIGTQSLTAALSGNFDKLADANQAYALTLIRTGDFTAAAAARTAVLSGEVSNATTAVFRSADADDRAAQASAGLGAALSEEAKKKIESKVAAAELAQEQANLERDSIRAANGMLGAGDQALILSRKYDIAIETAGALIRQQQALSNATALADQRKSEQTGTDLSAKQFDNFSKLRRAKEDEDTKEAERKRKEDAARQKEIRASENALSLARARTPEQRIGVLQAELRTTTDIVERNRILAQIEQERRTGATRGPKGLSATNRADLALAQAGEEGAARLQARLAEVNSQLSRAGLSELQRKQLTAEKLELERKISDELDKQADLALDARIAAIEDRRERRQEQQRLASASRILAAPGEFSAEQRAAAQDVLELIPLQQQKRARDIAQKAGAAGIAIPTGTAATTPTLGPIVPPTAAVAGITPPPAPQAGQPAQGQALILELDGKQVGRILLPDLIALLRQGRVPVSAAGG